MLSPISLLDPSVPHQTVIDEVTKHWRRVNFGEYVVSLALWRLRKDLVHRGSGLSRIEDFAEYHFGIHPKLASLFVAVGRHLERLPGTRAAMEQGDLTYTKVREFMRIATPEDEAGWIEYAKTHTNRDLEKKVARATAEKEGREHEDTRTVKSELNGEDVQTARKAREILRKEGEALTPEDKLLPRMLEKIRTGGLLFSEPGEEPKAGKPSGPLLAMHLCPTCLHTWVPVARENMEIPMIKWIEHVRKGGEVKSLLPDLLCDCEGVIHRRDECPRPGPRAATAASSRHLPAEVRRLIEARDGFRCRVPGCGTSVAMEGGHMEKPFRDGAPNDAANVGTQCAVHNRQIETGALRVVGFAPFEKYYLRDGTFLGWGFDPRIFEQGIHHVGEEPESGKRAPPELHGGEKQPA